MKEDQNTQIYIHSLTKSTSGGYFKSFLSVASTITSRNVLSTFLRKSLSSSLLLLMALMNDLLEQFYMIECERYSYM